ncbi:putative proteinral (type II) secretion pathway protein D precursor [Prochlorococcus marinus str. MIT 9302]|uniref:Type II/III secretion system secretin-like domain-containing protein n=1 Tax=Prochlorococcus marinus str. MIT 9302 TaxID=74545 RepID=A0A0A2A7V5_PROMR|nr:hypothetical protein [Prochlorococcus marinus]KGF97655.1 putative proteinral (type II) secretion pathway protein D precursor [Prochlorococcus marinus str. MIT 9302]
MKRKRNNLVGIFVVSLATFIFLDIPVYSDHNFELETKRYKQNAKFLDSISIGNIPEEKKTISLEIAKDQNFLKLIIKDVGFNSKVFTKYKEDIINFEITTINKRSIEKNEQIIEIPSQGIVQARLHGKEKNYKLDLKLDDRILKEDVQITTLGADVVLSFEKLTLTREEAYEKNMKIIAQPKSKKINIKQKGAIAPPLGDIAIGTTIIPNPNLLNLKGPKVSLVFKQTQSKKALEFLLSKANYGFVWVQKDPSYNPDGNSSSSTQTISNEGTNLATQSMDGSSMGLSNSQTPDSAEKNADSHRYITLTLKDVPFNNAFNAVLMASGMQAKLENGIVYVGPNVRESVFNSRISRVYRLNQTTANAAASYLANLGARVTRTTTIETAVTQGVSASSSVSGAANSSTTQSGSSTSVEVYGSDIGPLLGLIATTDDRLQTVTMIGAADVVSVAEEYLKKLDLRQRQVALSVKILDVQLDDGTSLSNSWAMKQNNNFIVNDSGKLITAFGKYLPPNESNDFADPRGQGDGSSDNVENIASDSSGTPPIVTTLTQVRRLNPVNMYTNQNFITFLRAQIVSKNTKILASPTLILNEFPGKSGGEAVTFTDVSEALSSGSIGRSYGNEGFVIVGNQLPINCTAEGDTASFEYGIAGLTFGARVLRIDDNGYVTFAISPSVSASSSTREINGCGIIDLLSVRRLDSGSIRVKDGHTLILTGVLNSNDKETITKFPFFGDLPIIGHFFRNRVSAKDQRELVIMVTPRLLDGSDGEFENINTFTSSYKDDLQ